MKTIYLYRSQKGNIYSAETKGALISLGFPEEEIEEVDVKLVPEVGQVPWEPKGGDWSVLGTMRAVDRNMGDDYRLAGSNYPTREQAEAVAKWDRFYRRLLALACELNPSGKPGSEWGVFLLYGVWNTWAACGRNGSDNVFETKESAKEACRIMNRDGWRLPV